MSQERVKLNIPGMCDEGPPSYSELEMHQGSRLRREKALAQIKENRTYCAHFSSIREIIDSQELEMRIKRYELGDYIDVEYFPEVSSDTLQDPRNLWLRKVDPATGKPIITNGQEDPWDTDQLLFLPDGAAPVNPGPTLMDIYAAMIIADRSRDRDFSDKGALEAAAGDMHAAITYVLGRVEATGAHLDQETKHRLTMAQLRGMPVEMLGRSCNLHRIRSSGVDLDQHPEYRTYQTFYEMGIAPPSHEEMANIIIDHLGQPAER